MRAAFLSCDDTFKEDTTCVSNWIMQAIKDSRMWQHTPLLYDRDNLKRGEVDWVNLDILFFHPFRRFDSSRRFMMENIWSKVCDYGICPVLVSDDLNVLDRHSKILHEWLGRPSQYDINLWKGPILHTNFKNIERMWKTKMFSHVFNPYPPVKYLADQPDDVDRKFTLGYVGCWAPRRIRLLNKYKEIVTLLGPGWDKLPDFQFAFPFLTPFRYLGSVYRTMRWALHIQDPWVSSSGARVSRIAESLQFDVPVLVDASQVSATPDLPWESFKDWIVQDTETAMQIIMDNNGSESHIAKKQKESELFRAFYDPGINAPLLVGEIRRWMER